MLTFHPLTLQCLLDYKQSSKKQLPKELLFLLCTGKQYIDVEVLYDIVYSHKLTNGNKKDYKEKYFKKKILRFLEENFFLKKYDSDFNLISEDAVTKEIFSAKKNINLSFLLPKTFQDNKYFDSVRDILISEIKRVISENKCEDLGENISKLNLETPKKILKNSKKAKLSSIFKLNFATKKISKEIQESKKLGIFTPLQYPENCIRPQKEPRTCTIKRPKSLKNPMSLTYIKLFHRNKPPKYAIFPKVKSIFSYKELECVADYDEESSDFIEDYNSDSDEIISGSESEYDDESDLNSDFIENDNVKERQFKKSNLGVFNIEITKYKDFNDDFLKIPLFRSKKIIKEAEEEILKKMEQKQDIKEIEEFISVKYHIYKHVISKKIKDLSSEITDLNNENLKIDSN